MLKNKMLEAIALMASADKSDSEVAETVGCALITLRCWRGKVEFHEELKKRKLEYLDFLMDKSKEAKLRIARPVHEK